MNENLLGFLERRGIAEVTVRRMVEDKVKLTQLTYSFISNTRLYNFQILQPANRKPPSGGLSSYPARPHNNEIVILFIDGINQILEYFYFK